MALFKPCAAWSADGGRIRDVTTMLALDLGIAVTQLAVAASGALLFALVGAVLVAGVQRASGRSLGAIAQGLRGLDAFLALRLARLVGLDEAGVWRRWGRLTGWFLGLAVAGALLPAVLATPLLLFGLILILAVVRRWTWDEEDRALGLASHHKRAPGGEDFNNELLAALSCVFMFGALLVWRLGELGLFDMDGAPAQGGNILYVASEALEALPIVGNIEVFGYDNPSGVEVLQPSGGGAAFAFRLVLDVLVIGGLLKAAEIAGRIARKQDIRREERALAAARTESEIDAALDAIVALARRGNPQATRSLESTALPPIDGVASSVGRRRAAADHLLDLGEEGAVLGPSALNTAVLAYEVLMTPELRERDPLEWHRCLAARSQAIYLLGLRAGGAGAVERLKTAQEGFKAAAEGFQQLGAVIRADRAELGYWAALAQWVDMTGDAPGVSQRELPGQIAEFIDRMTARAVSDPAVVAETRRLLGGVTLSVAAHGHGPVEVTGGGAAPDDRRTPEDRLNHAASVGLMVQRSASPEAFADLDAVIADLTALYRLPAESITPAERGTAALRLAQAWMTRVDLVHDHTRPASVEQALHWIGETQRLAGPDLPRVTSIVRALEARCLSIKAALTPPGPDQDRLVDRVLETYRRVVHDPLLAGDALLDESKANMVIALIGAADRGLDRPRSIAQLREAEALSADLLDQPTTARDRAMKASVLLNRSNARRALAALSPLEARKSLFVDAAEDAERAAAEFAETGNVHGRSLALKSRGHAHAGVVEIEESGPQAEAQARLALDALEGSLAVLDPVRQFGLWFDALHGTVSLMAYLGRVDGNRDAVVESVARLDRLIAASRDGPLAIKTPFLEQQRGKILATLNSWSPVSGPG